MPLPFLKAKPVAGLIISHRKADGGKVEEDSAENEDAGITSCAEDLIRAIHAKDAKSVAAAMRAAFQIMESEPHEENPNDFDSMNEKAAKEQE